ncbi:MAG TPA: DUF4267 domain-containing protein [Beijerinckiaceae bacterium]|nr:DUF4267 domain-containing protein [Beijerinckiaceae bacterium]
MALRDPMSWLVLGLAALFLWIGLLLAAAPRVGAQLFGIPSLDDDSLAYVRALGFRDLALALYIVALTLWTSRRALAIVLGITVLIPLLDFGLVLAARGFSSPWHLAMHAGSAAVFAGLALSCARSRRADAGPNVRSGG